MAETPQSTPDTDKAPQRDAEQSAGRNGSQAVEGERQLFQQSGADRAGIHSAAALAQQAADTSRRLAESGRSAGREVADTWRTAIEPFASMQMEMNRWFDDAFRQVAGFGFLPTLRAARPFAAAGAAPLFGLPATDIKETDKAYELSIELPGLSREDVDLSVHGDMLSISGHKTESRDDASAAYRISERRYGRFERSFPIPADVERGQINAAFENGVLKITLPRNPAIGPQRSKIEIKG
jgi:HSP20 family protein